MRFYEYTNSCYKWNCQAQIKKTYKLLDTTLELAYIEDEISQYGIMTEPNPFP